MAACQLSTSEKTSTLNMIVVNSYIIKGLMTWNRSSALRVCVYESRGIKHLYLNSEWEMQTNLQIFLGFST